MEPSPGVECDCASTGAADQRAGDSRDQEWARKAIGEDASAVIEASEAILGLRYEQFFRCQKRVGARN